ncbi:MAG: hypothetical protein LAT62_15255 [Natronospirillum sp.]|uniref:lipopolysaccharide kinase InaA family protein n=1 Tax=Natronospirillum sp. TaxID=2812955 RepID=UPI002600B6AD|nr:lipopolysaccharide kinase InaA family protein [Natronospirillum sp.]MCH8553295.1 hypothetical protein [Natronospirillum sp.]
MPSSKLHFLPLSELPLPQSLQGYSGELTAPLATAEALNWVAALPQRLEAESDGLIFRNRNRVFRLPDLPGWPHPVCVKVFKTPGRLRAMTYRRQGSKAERAHRHARFLFEHEAGVATPLGYFERWEGPRLVASYLISGFLEDASDLFTEMTHIIRERPYAADFVALLRTAAVAIRAMHDSGFVHRDLGAQNILLRREDGQHWGDVMFIDLNRGRILDEVSLRERARDLCRLQIPSHFRRIFHHLYFEDGEVPSEFARWEAHYRARIRRHQATRKYRHPIRHWKRKRRDERIRVTTGRPPERDIWLWDHKSGQPSVVLQGKDRRRHRKASDALHLLLANLRHALPLRRHYRRLAALAYQQPVTMAGRLGVCVEADELLDEQLDTLQQAPGTPVLIRAYYHLGSPGLDAVERAAQTLHQRGHEVSVGLIQSRQAVLHPDQWCLFCSEALQRTAGYLSFVEVGHAVNRVKWGFWTLEEMNRVWAGIKVLRETYPHLRFLGPAVNDFEYHYYPPLLDATKALIDGVPCHLYIDRRGQPENYQGRFSLLEKCIYGRAVAEHWQKDGFYITETNWPLTGTGEHSPLAGAYNRQEYRESPLHVDEATSAAWMIRMALIAVCSGMTERLWWWRLLHHGFGLLDDQHEVRIRPGWRALVQFNAVVGPLTFKKHWQDGDVRWWDFNGVQVVYALEDTDIELPQGVQRITDMAGADISQAAGTRLKVSGNPVYLHF